MSHYYWTMAHLWPIYFVNTYTFMELNFVLCMVWDRLQDTRNNLNAWPNTICSIVCNSCIWYRCCANFFSQWMFCIRKECCISQKKKKYIENKPSNTKAILKGELMFNMSKIFPNQCRLTSYYHEIPHMHTR